MSNQPAGNLPERLKKTGEFFDPENLASLSLKYAEGEVALLVIDVQKQFCDPEGKRGNKETTEISERIQSLVPEFRKADIPVYAVYYSTTGDKEREEVDFYKFQPAANDTLIAKNADSAFKGSNIADILHRDHKKLLLACGFNLNACVKRTIDDARKAGFDVCLMEDLSGNDALNAGYSPDTFLKQMREGGTVITSSENVLRQINAPSL